MRSVLTDVRPLRESNDFRRLWLGQTVSQLGQQMTAVTVSIQVYALTGSTFSVGLVGIFALVPLVAFGLYGGAVADAVDRRTLALVSSSGLWLLSMLLAVQALLHWDRTWILYAVVAAQSACFAVNNPARSAIIPRLLRPELLPAANTLSHAAFNAGFTIGPLVGAALIAWEGFAAAYLVDVMTFTAALYALFRLPPVPPEPSEDGAVRRPGLRSVVEGFAFLRSRRCCWRRSWPTSRRWCWRSRGRCSRPSPARSSAAVCGPSACSRRRRRSARLVAVLFSGWVGRVRRQGVAIVVSVCVYAAAVGLFGLSRTIWLGVALLALSGAADMISAAYRGTILQAAAPDAMRGRLQGVFIVVVAGGPRLGDFVIGSTASLTTPTVALLAGATACIVAVLVLLWRNVPFRRYDREVRAIR